MFTSFKSFCFALVLSFDFHFVAFLTPPQIRVFPHGVVWYVTFKPDSQKALISFVKNNITHRLSVLMICQTHRFRAFHRFRTKGAGEGAIRKITGSRGESDGQGSGSSFALLYGEP